MENREGGGKLGLENLWKVWGTVSNGRAFLLVRGRVGKGCSSQRVLLSFRCSVVSDSLWPHGLLPARLLCLWAFLGKNTRAGCHFLLQEIFPTQGWNPWLLRFRRILHHWAPGESPLGPYFFLFLFNWSLVDLQGVLVSGVQVFKILFHYRLFIKIFYYKLLKILNLVLCAIH